MDETFFCLEKENECKSLLRTLNAAAPCEVLLFSDMSHHALWAATHPYLSEAQSVGHYAVHSIGVHLRPLQLEVKDARPVLPQRVVGVVVELWRVGLSCRRAERRRVRS